MIEKLKKENIRDTARIYNRGLLKQIPPWKESLKNTIEKLNKIETFVYKEKDWKIAESEEEAIKVLLENNLIDENLYLKLKEAKGMRNFIVHQYDKIDDEIVFKAVSKELIKNTKEFIRKIKRVK